MILHLAVLSGLLYTGYSKLKKKPDPEYLTDLVEEENIPPQKKSEYKVKLDTGKDAEYSFIAASLGLGLATIGAFSYGTLSLISIPFSLYAVRKNNKIAYELAKQGEASTDTLITLTIVGSAIIGKIFIASLIVFLVKLATKLTAIITHKSKHELFDAFEKQIDFVWVLIDDIEIKTPFYDIKAGDIVVVHAGEIIPADGAVVKGIASVDQHILTGEARPIEKENGDSVFASTIVLSGKIDIKVKRAGTESTVAKITDILNKTIDFKSTIQLRVEKLSDQLVTPALTAGAIALPLLGFSGALAVINAHPKNKMMIIAPLTILNYLNLASKQGILIKDGRSLELLHQVDTIVFDKTGTLTEEQPYIGTIHCCSHYTENQILIYAATAEYKQKHPLARAILQETKKRSLTVLPIQDSEYKLGYGIKVRINKKMVYVGSERFMAIENITIPSSIKHQQRLCHEQGYTLVIIAIDHQIIGAIELLPTIRPEAKAVITKLRQRSNIKAMYIISGDNEIPTKQLAQNLGIDHYFAEALPENKANIIEELQEKGHCICYIGDGVNDSIALKKSQVSISLRGASTIATDTASIILMDQGLIRLEQLFDIADHYNANMHRTLAMMLVPGIIGVTGAFLLGFTIVQTVFLNMTGLVLAVGNAMLPLLEKTSNEMELETEEDIEHPK